MCSNVSVPVVSHIVSAVTNSMQKQTLVDKLGTAIMLANEKISSDELDCNVRGRF